MHSAIGWATCSTTSLPWDGSIPEESLEREVWRGGIQFRQCVTKNFEQ